MSDQRQQLDQTRDELQKAAQAAGDGSVAQALASGTRAQRQLQEMRDEMRKQNSNQFADDMRNLRNEARELSRQQDQITQKLDQLGNQRTQRRSLSDTGDRKELLDQLAQQQERMNKLVDRAQGVSEQSENTEPLLSRQLYDSIRKLSQDDDNAVKQAREDLAASGAMNYELRERLQKTGDREGSGKALEVTRDMLDQGAVAEAGRASDRARAGLDQLRKGVERAAESVLGDDAEALKMAQSELDQLTDQLQREIAEAGRNGGAAENQNQNERDEPNAKSGSQRGQQAGQPGQRGQPGEQLADGSQPGGDQSGSAAQDREGEQQGKQGGDRGERQVAQNDSKQGRSGGRGQQPGDPSQPGQRPGEQSGENSSENPGAGGGGGAQAGDADRVAGNDAGDRANNDPSRRNATERETERRRGGREGANRLAGGPNNRGGNRDGRPGVDDFLNDGYGDARNFGGWEGGRVWRGPLTGEEFNRWNERLRDVEDLIENPEMRSAVAVARERARQLRRDFKQDAKKPDWASVQLQIVKPLVEVRNRVADELARRDSKESLAPIDRDPVPNRFAESVRRYYEELGKDK
jgi:hypothetical protein